MLGVAGATSYFGAVGNDAYGQVLTQCATEDGVKVHYQKTENIPTGTCAVLINGGERSLVAKLAAANTFHVSHLDSEESKALIEK